MLENYEKTQFDAEAMSFPVYVSSSPGPPVVVLHEMPNLSPQVVSFADAVVASGYKVYVPSFTGEPGPTKDTARIAVRICLEKAFRGFTGSSTRPVVRWIRALIDHASMAAAGQSVGIIGMCFSGGFALGAATHGKVAAAVACQPGLPLAGSIPIVRGVTGADKDIDVSDGDLAVVHDRISAGELAVQAYRFDGDGISPCERMRKLHHALGPDFDARCIPRGYANNAVKSPPHHSVVTLHLVDEEGSPTREARDRILAFLDWRLRAGPALAPPSIDLRACGQLGCASRTR